MSCILLISFSGSLSLYTNSFQGYETEYSCVNCTTVRITKKDYYGNVSDIIEFQCSGNTPYCNVDSGTCVQTTDVIECNRSTTNKFTCSNDGYYPNPTNCKKYFVCIKGRAYEMDCGTGYYYNPKSENCYNQNYCNTISCDKKSGIKVAHESDYRFYGYCYNQTLISFEKCPGQFQFDFDKQVCLPVCKTEGLQGDPHDCTMYYKCSYEYVSSKSSYNLLLNHQKCYSEEYFDSVNLRCAPLKAGLQCESGLVYLHNETFVHKDFLRPNMIATANKYH